MIYLIFGAFFGVGVWLFGDYQQAARARAPMLPVTFAHSDHDAVNCADCHHEFLDAIGRGQCFDCHKTDPSVNALIEEQFHQLCQGCHVDLQAAGETHGPTRQCHACHTADNEP